MIGLVFNEQLSSASITSVDLAASKLLLMTTKVLISTTDTNYDELTKHYTAMKSIQVIPSQTEFQNCGYLTDIYSASCQFQGPTEFLTLSPKYSNLDQEVLSILADNQNSYATTTNNNFYEISHFSVERDNLIPYLNLQNFSLEEFITEELQCLPITFVKSDII
ncbi:hypothetical protein [Companilactobacillus sp. HBUAS59699]|uniref:hypothetical protein n=1 Tax=Companilactobacillus sp. HBUAS59699 TaxID=3109358 RepID=UPI002FF4105C